MGEGKKEEGEEKCQVGDIISPFRVVKINPKSFSLPYLRGGHVLQCIFECVPAGGE